MTDTERLLDVTRRLREFVADEKAFMLIGLERADARAVLEALERQSVTVPTVGVCNVQVAGQPDRPCFYEDRTNGRVCVNCGRAKP